MDKSLDVKQVLSVKEKGGRGGRIKTKRYREVISYICAMVKRITQNAIVHPKIVNKIANEKYFRITCSMTKNLKPIQTNVKKIVKILFLDPKIEEKLKKKLQKRITLIKKIGTFSF